VGSVQQQIAKNANFNIQVSNNDINFNVNRYLPKGLRSEEVERVCGAKAQKHRSNFG
jgi:hypothetical protein